MVGFLWVGLALDFPALENAMVGFTTKHVVGYEVSVLLGSNTRDEIVDKVFRTELVFSILLASYSTLLFGLAFVKGLFRRLKVLAFGAGIPLLGLLLLFWVKFLSDDHIISSGEKTELFLLSIIGVSIGVALCWFGMLQLSRKPKISLDDFELPSEVSVNKPSDDLLDELKERDQGKSGDGIEPEQTESSTTTTEEKDQSIADADEEPSEESLEEVSEVVPEPLAEALSGGEAPEPIDEVSEAQPVIDEAEDVPPPPLPELAEEALEESIEEEVAEVVPEPLAEALSGGEAPEPIDEVSEALPVIDEAEDVRPPPLPELAEEALEESIEEEVSKVVPEPLPEALSEEEAPEPIDEASEVQPVIDEAEDIPSLALPEIAEEPLEESVEEEVAEVVPEPSPEAPHPQPLVSKGLPSEVGSESSPPPDIDEKANPSTLDHDPREVEGGEPSPLA